MNKIVKYIICIVLTLVVTCTVVLMPYFYYSVNDNKDKNAVTETFSISGTNDKLTVDEYIKLISSNDSTFMWVDRGMPAVNESLCQEVRSALTILNLSFKENKYAFNAIDRFIKYTSNASAQGGYIRNILVSGRLSDKPVNASLLYLEVVISKDDDYSDNREWVYVILMNRKTSMVYEFQCLPLDNNEVVNNYDEDNNDDIYKSTFDSLMSYWETADSKLVTIDISENDFRFNILPYFFSDYLYNRYSLED